MIFQIHRYRGCYSCLEALMMKELSIKRQRCSRSAHALTHALSRFKYPLVALTFHKRNLSRDIPAEENHFEGWSTFIGLFDFSMLSDNHGWS